MTDMTMNEERSSRKKLLVPLVVLLLCGVAFTGAAYAYNATLGISGNSADSGYLTIDLATGTNNASADVTLTGNNVVTYTDHFTYSAISTTSTKTNTIQYELATVDIASYKLTIARESDNSDAVKFTAALNNFGNVKVYSGGSQVALSTLGSLSCVITQTADSTTTTVDTIELDSSTLSGSKASLALGTYTVTLKFTATSTAAATAYGPCTYGGTDPAWKTASDLQTVFDAQTFGITFTAEPVSA